MQVFKMLWKIILAKKKVLYMYTFIFLLVFMGFTYVYSNKENSNSGFNETQTVLAIKDLDQSEVSKAFSAYINDYAVVEDIDTSTDEKVKDALFYTKIAYYIEIPKGFQEAFISDTPMALNIQNRPDSTYNVVSEQLIDGYLQNLSSYMKTNPDRSISEIDAQIRHIQDNKVEVEMYADASTSSEIIGLGMYFNYLFYIFTALFIMIGGTVLLAVYDQEIRKRNLLSPVTQLSFNAQLAFGCISFAVMYWALFMVFVQVIMGGLFTEVGIYFMINSLIMVFVCMGLTFLIANILAGKRNNEEALNACSNILALGSSFLCGVFIPQFLLGETVKLFSSFLPAFWYVKGNEMITAMPINGLDIAELCKTFGIQALFGVVFFLLALWISKTKASAKEFA